VLPHVCSSFVRSLTNSKVRNAIECPQSTPLTPPQKPFHFAGWEFGNLQSGVPNLLPKNLQWIWSRTGLLVPFPTPQHGSGEEPKTSILPDFNKTPLDLPKESLLNRFLNVYICSPMRRIFPVIDPALFSQTIQTAYSDRISPAEKYSAQACILAFMAMFSSLYHFDPGYHGAELPPIPRDTYIAHATAFLPAIVQESLNLDALQTAILLVSFHCFIFASKLPCPSLITNLYYPGNNQYPRR
jgi:hypothetical protein